MKRLVFSEVAYCVSPTARKAPPAGLSARGTPQDRLWWSWSLISSSGQGEKQLRRKDAVSKIDTVFPRTCAGGRIFAFCRFAAFESGRCSLDSLFFVVLISRPAAGCLHVLQRQAMMLERLPPLECRCILSPTSRPYIHEIFPHDGTALS
ncbi:hypothetical protein LIA77_04946 [Sarocladium implicatum]|nr:hypothetical protein LIA77_04946 [Sarocladium implicatum]